MRRITIGLAAGALLSLVMAASAHAVSTEATWTSSSTASPANGTAKAPAPFSASWDLSAKNNIDPSYRAAVPRSWSWSWEGVKVRQAGVPVCTVDQVNDAKSVSVCPPGARIGISDPAKFIAEFGPIGLAEGPNTTCLGKVYELFNGGPGQITMVIDGPPEQCASLGFLGAYPLVLATSGGRTSMTWNLPENLQNPFPGAEGGLPLASMTFNAVKASGKSAVAAKKGKKKKKKKAKRYLLESINCKGTRDFTMTVVDPYGTHVINANAGNCKAPKKAKKKKKKK